MDIYLVGGAIRDELLGLPVTERDWVVVNATAEQMRARGFKPVGRDFPVFLHPDTGEEYALARTERKSGHGYTGFEFHAAPDVTLEQDLMRRDLTINAMARHESGTLNSTLNGTLNSTLNSPLIDPYNGRQDLQDRVLRHVSEAFVEDPLRVLRVARFVARYHHLGFRVADETCALMKRISASGELCHLTPERVWKELSRALMATSPERFLSTLHECGALTEVLPEIAALEQAIQRPNSSSQDNALQHLYRCLAQAQRLQLPLSARYALLCHDCSPTTDAQHCRTQSAQRARQLSERLRLPRETRDTAILLANHQCRIIDALNLEAPALLALLHDFDVLRRPQRLQLVLAACNACQQAHHHDHDPAAPFPQADYLLGAATAIGQINAAELQRQGLHGAALGKALTEQRRQALEHYRMEFIQQWQMKHNGPSP